MIFIHPQSILFVFLPNKFVMGTSLYREMEIRQLPGTHHERRLHPSYFSRGPAAKIKNEPGDEESPWLTQAEVDFKIAECTSITELVYQRNAKVKQC